LLRAEIDSKYQEKAAWWTRLQEADPVTQTQMLTDEVKKHQKPRMKKKRKKTL
jgi:hypothetical protein